MVRVGGYRQPNAAGQEVYEEISQVQTNFDLSPPGQGNVRRPRYLAGEADVCINLAAADIAPADKRWNVLGGEGN